MPIWIWEAKGLTFTEEVAEVASRMNAMCETQQQFLIPAERPGSSRKPLPTAAAAVAAPV